MRGYGLEVDKHMNLECTYVVQDKLMWKPQDMILCCGKSQLRNLETGHLCNPKQQDRFCEVHKRDEHYLISNTRIYADEDWKTQMYEVLLQDFGCYFCKFLPRTPMLCNNKNCQIVFCKACINKLMWNDTKLCPKCYQPIEIETDKHVKHHKMVQMFLLINKLNMQLKCKNHINGCNFKAALTESINKSNNIGFTLNNHILRNHELGCNSCLKCKHQCQNCKIYVSNA